MHRIDQWIWNEGIFDILTHFKQQGFLLILITNQSGIHRRYYSFSDFCHLSLWVQQILKQQLGFGLDKIYFCPHTPNESCLCRKPQTGMIHEAIKDFPFLDLSHSILIGDSWTDILVARNMGLKQAFWITHEKSHPILNHNEIIIHQLKQIMPKINPTNKI